MKRSSKTKRASVRRHRPAPSPLVATQREAAQALGVSLSTLGRMLDRWSDDGKLIEKKQLPRLPGLRRVLIPRVAIEDFLSQVANRTAS